MDYSALIANVLSNECLKNEVDDIAKRTQALNLIDSDWENKLKNHPTFQRHEGKKVKYSKYKDCANTKASVKKILSPNDYFNVLVVGAFCINVPESNPAIPEIGKRVNDVSIVTRECAPLTMIAESMAENQTQTLHDGARLFVQTCQAMFCNSCVQFHKHIGQRIPRNNWCILMTRAFDGQKVSMRSRGTILNSLLQMNRFLAIMHINVSSVTSFGDCSYKVGGLIKEMVCFQESSLFPPRDFNLQALPDVTEALPSIEIPESDDENKTEDIVHAIPKPEIAHVIPESKRIKLDVVES